MKSNVDVYLASDMLFLASKITEPTTFILVSCDGDYTEALKNIAQMNSKISIMALATPYVKNHKKNTLSVRLKQLTRELGKPRFILNDIQKISSEIKSNKIGAALTK